MRNGAVLLLLATGAWFAGCREEPIDCDVLCDKAADCNASIEARSPAEAVGLGLSHEPPTEAERKAHQRKDCQARCAAASDERRRGKLRVCAGIKSCGKFARCMYPHGKGIQESQRPAP